MISTVEATEINKKGRKEKEGKKREGSCGDRPTLWTG
jgi:hypothetical protein